MRLEIVGNDGKEITPTPRINRAFKWMNEAETDEERWSRFIRFQSVLEEELEWRYMQEVFGRECEKSH